MPYGYADLANQQSALRRLYGVAEPELGAYGSGTLPGVGADLPPAAAQQAFLTQEASGLQGLPTNPEMASSDTRDAVARPDDGAAAAMQSMQSERPVMISPGGISLAQRTVTHGAPISEGTMQGLYAGQAMEQQGVENVARTAKARASDEGDLAHQQAAQAEQNYVVDAARYKAQGDALADAKAQSDAAFDDIRNGAEDPGRYFAKMDPFAKVMSLIGVALSGMGGGPNKAMEILNRAQDQDIAAQRQGLASKRGYAESKRTALGDLMKIHGDQNVAVADLRARQSTALAAQAAEIAARYKGTEKEAEVMQATGRLMQDAAKDVAKFEEAKADHISEQFVNRAPVYAGGGGGGGGGAPKGAKEKDYDAQFVPELGGIAQTVEEARALRTQTAKMSEYERTAGELLKMREDSGNFVSPSRRAEMSRKASKLALLTKDIEQLGALTKSDMSLMPIDPDAGTSMMPGTSAGIQEALSQVRAHRANLGATAGIVPATQGVVTDPRTGRRVLTTELRGAEEATAAPRSTVNFKPMGR